MNQHSTHRTRPWPDMSAYGLYFGVLDMPNGESRMVMVDRDGAWGALAKQMGFSQSRWFGLYVKSSLKLDIPGFKTNFPSAKVVQLTDQEIRERVRPLILERRDKRLSQMAGKRLSWHPNRTAVADAASAATAAEADADAEEPSAVSPQSALRQTLFLGMNAMGQEVFESGDGLRFAKSGDAIVAREAGEMAPSPTFLRASTDEELTQIAAGMVREIDAGKRLSSDDFVRYVETVFGPGATEDKENVGRFHAAVDRAMMDRVVATEGAGRDAFNEALRLHEGRPSFWRAPGSFSTPLPISVVMQSLAAARVRQSVDAGVDPVVIDVTTQPRSHSWSLGAVSVAAGELPKHDVALAGVYGLASIGNAVSGVRITRSDTEALLASFAKRSDDGLSVFLVTADKAGKLDNEFRRAMSLIGQHYEVAGLVDLDASLIGPGNERASRLVVIGRKRKEQDYTFSVPGNISVLYDYEALWNWGEALRAAELGQAQTFGDDGREENRWQAPYIPSSQVSEPEAMSPRNLLGPVREALGGIVERNGMGIDEFVCERMGWTMQQLEERLSAEQADAVAIGIQAIDDGMGMVEADATGLGKGRVAATLATYGKRKGIPVVFMTLTADLFADFYRDVEDVGCMDDLRNPFIVNNDVIVCDVATGEEIVRSPKRDEAQLTLACGEFPKDRDLVLATYSQFNRNYDPKDAVRNSKIARVIRDLLKGEAETFDALASIRHEIGLDDYPALGVTNLEQALQHEQRAAAVQRAAGNDAGANRHSAAAELLSKSKSDLLEALGTHIKADLTTLKHQWLYAGALGGSLLILDEAHAAAGEVSQTGVNFRFLVDNAAAVAYSSATFAKDIGNFELYSRLFPSTLRVATIGETLARGGEPMQEIVSGMLAKEGRLIRREHDLSNLEFKLSTDTGRLERNERWANGLAEVLAAMSALSGEVSDAVSAINDAETKKAVAAAKAALPVGATKKSAKQAPVQMLGVQYTNFSSKFYNISRAFMMAVNADQASDLAIKALQEGRKPVITVENTMETVLKELIEGVDPELGIDLPADQAAQASGEAIAKARGAKSIEAGDLLAGLEPDNSASAGAPKKRRGATEEFRLGRRVSFKDILHAYVDSMFHANEQQRLGNKILSSKRISMLTPELEKAAAELHRLIDQMPEVPLSPIDLVRERISSAGFSVDEISGRRYALKTDDDSNHKVVRMSERKKQPLKHAFNSGALDALILSKSGSTGISLHASRTFADQSQRELIELQPAADIAQRLQFWGRVNRKGQVCSPIIRMLSSGLPAETRLITMQNAKLRRMSANISGNADNSALNEDAPDILNRIGNEVCYRWMEANPKISAIIGYRVGDIPEEAAVFGNTKFVDMLTGRLSMLHVDTQRTVYRELTAEFKALVEQYELEGKNPLKATEFDLRARRTGSAVLQVATAHDSVFNEAVTATELTYPISLPALDPAPIEQEAEDGRKALEDAHGKDYAKTLTDRCWKACREALPSLLSKRFQSVEAALADEKTNAVKNAMTKYGWLVDKLPTFVPGAILHYVNADGDDGGIERIFVTGWKVPAANPLSLAEYKIVGYSETARKKVELSMSSLCTRDGLWGLQPNSRQYKAQRDEFFNYCSTPVSGDQQRIVLDGNLYRAAEIAETQSQGTTITYSDDRGVWRHAVLLPKGYTLQNVMDMPVAINDVDTMAAVFKSRDPKRHSYAVITDDLRVQSERRTYRLYGDAEHLTVASYAASEKAGWMLNCADIKKCLVNGDFGGSRGYREGRVLEGMEMEFFKAFMDAADKAGVKMMMGGEMRGWYNEYLASRAAPKTEQDVVDAAMSTKEDDELGALLATP